MGFDDLVLVSPRDKRVLNRQQTVQGASGANDVLEKARVCERLEEALDGMDVVCATGMPNDMHREREEREYYAPRVYFDGLLKKVRGGEEDESHSGSGGSGVHLSDDSAMVSTIPNEVRNSKQEERPLRVAFLFGNERKGMRDEDIDECHAVLGIPTNPEFGSLNLASAVQLIAYDWREAVGGY
eukprot:CAMPEP_0195517082 /NCGR_PEP_ID=MMETSP0794_2-20130614/9586_1 /TAXON_ID=515487 /ORGANISM="Stephanopyxis turris, Strain CCMP 815" /LENGTH=183 /DNA_ID=CAMNT_0040645829 /DNA_START=211 /DNA_END=762 /DNA_ORIENTATION=-